MSWDADAETQIVEQDGLKYLLMWTPLQSGEGRPQSAITADPITRSAVSGPEGVATQDAHRQMFDRLTDHNSKKPLVARRALAAIKRGTDTLESINAANREFWSGKMSTAQLVEDELPARTALKGAQERLAAALAAGEAAAQSLARGRETLAELERRQGCRKGGSCE